VRIAFFDSGIGGLTVLHQAIKQMPQEDYLYYADTDHVPYGRKTKEEIRQYVQEAVDFIATQDVKALVVACNTATSVAIQSLRARYSFPILGMEPAVKPAVRNAVISKRVLVTATPVTLREQKMQDLLLQVDQNHKTDLLPLPKLVELAERGCFEDGQAEAYLREVLQEYDLSQYCTVVLGCTHFNYFKDSFRNIFGDGVTLLDGSGGTVNNLHRVLAEQHLLEQNTGDIRYYTSGREAEELRPRYDLLLNRLEKMLQY
jgi:glutamate racemase